MSVNILKEKFAFATSAQEREEVVRQHALPSSDDWFYYHGLVLLQRLHECVSQRSADAREATPQEAELVTEIREHLRKQPNVTARSKQLNARFELLSYPINTAESAEYIRKKLGIRSISSSNAGRGFPSEEDPGSPVPSASHDSMYPTRLDPSLIDPKAVVERTLRTNASTSWVNALLLPATAQSDDQDLLSLLTTSIPQHRNDHIAQLAAALQKHDGRAHKISFEYLTLEQLDALRQFYPSVADENTSYLRVYLAKLVDNDPKDYVKLWAFIKTLKEEYVLKRCILYYLLRDKMMQGDFSDLDLFNAYLDAAHVSGEDVSPRLRTIPHLPAPQDYNEFKSEFLAGALMHDPEGTSNAIRQWRHYKTALQKLHATLLIQQQPTHAWAQQFLGPQELEQVSSRVELSFPRYTTKLYYENRPLMPEDPIRLTVRIKNMKHVSVRAYQMDLFQYWRRVQRRTKQEHRQQQLAVNDINLDGLCPTWETELDFSDVSPLQRTDKTWTLDDPAAFAGRGAWVIDVVGGRNSCRAVVQKGRLRHLVKDTSAGHLFRILDERSQVVHAKLWINNIYYEADEQGNILLPYRDTPNNEERAQALIVTEEDGYCEPVLFTWKKEDYTLVADFHVHSESLVANKQSKILVVPRLMIHGQEVSLSLLQSVSLTVEATTGNQVKSTFTKEKLQVKRNQPIEMAFTVPSSLSCLRFELNAKVQTTSSTMPLQDVQVEDSLDAKTAAEPITSAYLRMKNDGEYVIQMLGRNGEPRKGVVVNLGFQHAMVAETINVNLQSDEHGMIFLGKLDHINHISASHPFSKSWDLVPGHTQSRLPNAIYHASNKPLKLAYPRGTDQCCTLFQVGEHGSVLHDMTDKINVMSESIDVPSGLPAGRYAFYLASSANSGENVCYGVRKIDCTIIDVDTTGDKDTVSSPHWSNWLISSRVFAQSTGRPITSPISIDNIEVTNSEVTVQLKDWSSSNTVALISTSAFVPERDVNIARSLIYDQVISGTAVLKTSVDTFAAFLEGRKLSEEFQYILNRGRTEKWVGSTLTKPSSVIYPEESQVTLSTAHHLDGERPHQSMDSVGVENRDLFSSDMCYAAYNAALPSHEATWDLNFLNHDTPTIAVRPDDQGKLQLNRCLLGSGNILHIAIHQDEQALTKQITLPNAPMDLNRQNMCHQTDKDASVAYVRTRSVSTLTPGESTPESTVELTIGQHEWETVHTFEKMYDLLRDMTQCDALRDFEFLKRWTSMTLAQKCKHHRQKVCHELNLWIKHRDPSFFDEQVKPFIQCKLKKDFMDLYLTDEDLRIYAHDLSMYQKLSIIEKALLAKTLPDMVPITLQAFKDAYMAPSETTADTRFESILTGSVLSGGPFAMMSQLEMDHYSAASASFGAAAPPAPGHMGALCMPQMMKMSARSTIAGAKANRRSLRAFEKSLLVQDQDESTDELESDVDGFVGPSSDESDESATSEHVDDANQDDKFLQEEELRQLLKKRLSKAPYTFAKATREWREKEYYHGNTLSVSVNQFWIDFLEHTSGPFVSSNFMYASSDLIEIMAILSLMDLPFQGDAHIKQESNLESGRFIITAETPCLVYYRALKRADTTPPANPTILLGQGFFVKEEATDDELEMVDPCALRPSVDYGWHLAISNVSSKKCTAEVTMQVPLGSIPTASTAYFQSRTVQVDPYSTWRGVVGSFYFPECGEYDHPSVTVSRSSVVLGQTQPVHIKVAVPDEGAIMEAASSSSSNAAWVALAANSKDDTLILDYLENKANLQKIDLRLLGWRMHQPEFASKVLQVLRKRLFFSYDLWQYGLYHRFPDAIRELVLQSGQDLISLCGGMIESPLVTSRSELKVLDYDPMAGARAHPFENTNRIWNTTFFAQYNELLDYLCQVQQATVSDLTMLTIYLILQERIGEAQAIYKRLSEKSPNPSIQMDYLQAYLQTRIRVEDAANDNTLDLELVRAVVDKYKSCLNDKWRQLFMRLGEFLKQVEQPTSLNAGTECLNHEQQHPDGPILDVSIGSAGKLTLHYANVTEVKIRYYKMDVEVMFSMNPFMGQQQSVQYDWIKPAIVQTVACPTASAGQQATADDAKTDEDSDFAVIGVGKMTTSSLVVDMPESLLHTNAMVQITSNTGLEHRKAHFSNDLAAHFIEAYGIVRVAGKQTSRPLAGSYVKVYARLKKEHGHRVEFWKDGYTGLNGVFDYVTVTDGNALVARPNKSDSDAVLQEVVEGVEKFSLLIQSVHNGALVEEVYPPAL